MSIVHFLKKYRYPTLVFLTGAAVLVIEIAATRILSPYYGNTIYTVSAVISVILASLSVGYARGGKEADLEPTEERFYRTIYHGAIALVVLFLFVIAVLPGLGNLFSLRVGPLVWSIILFAPSAYFFGKMSPFAVKLALLSPHHAGLGEVTGNIFFWSTAGSITGSILTGFVFIPFIGIKSILFLTTIFLLLLGGAGYIIHASSAMKRNRLINLVFLILALSAIYVIDRANHDPEILYQDDGIYEQITIRDTTYSGRPARFFLQDRSLSGATYLDNPNEMVFDYTKYYSLYKLWNRDTAHVVFLGGGIYTMPRALHEEVPSAQIEVVDIEPDLETIAKKYFFLPSTPKIRTHTEDGVQFLARSNELYDLIFSDVYFSLFSIPSHFTTHEFFSLAKDKLTDDGVFIANVIGRNDHRDNSFLLTEIKTMRSVFPHMKVYAVDSVKSKEVQNFILVGAKNDTVTSPASSTDKFLKELSARELSITDLSSYEILTNDHAPIEYLVTEFFSRNEHRIDSETEIPEETAIASARSMIEHIENIVAIGPRAVGTEGNISMRTYIKNYLRTKGIAVETQIFSKQTARGKTLALENIIVRLAPEEKNRILIGTHYDSITRAYRDNMDPYGYMPGANNSASGVALLLELATYIHHHQMMNGIGVDIVFFDGEEGELGLGAGDPNFYPIGSTHFVSSIGTYYAGRKLKEAIVVDMVCDKDLGLTYDMVSSKSNPSGYERLWRIGRAFSPSAFSEEAPKREMYDDHTPFAQAGIPATLLIDFDFEPWFNTTNDTPDKCSTASLGTIYKTLNEYIRS